MKIIDSLLELRIHNAKRRLVSNPTQVNVGEFNRLIGLRSPSQVKRMEKKMERK